MSLHRPALIASRRMSPDGEKGGAMRLAWPRCRWAEKWRTERRRTRKLAPRIYIYIYIELVRRVSELGARAFAKASCLVVGSTTEKKCALQIFLAALLLFPT